MLSPWVSLIALSNVTHPSRLGWPAPILGKLLPTIPKYHLCLEPPAVPWMGYALLCSVFFIFLLSVPSNPFHPLWYLPDLLLLVFKFHLRHHYLQTCYWLSLLKSGAHASVHPQLFLLDSSIASSYHPVL